MKSAFALAVIAILAIESGSSVGAVTEKPCNVAAVARTGIETTFGIVTISPIGKNHDEAEKNCQKYCSTLVKRRLNQADHDSLAKALIEVDTEKVFPSFLVATDDVGTCQTVRVDQNKQLVYERVACDALFPYVCELTLDIL